MPPMAATPDTEALGRRIAFYREKRGLSQKELAARIGVHVQQMSKYERGANEPGALKLRDIAWHLKVGQSRLTGRENPETEKAIEAFSAAMIQLEGKPPREDEQNFLRVLIEAFWRTGSPTPSVLRDFLAGFRNSPELRAEFYVDT